MKMLDKKRVKSAARKLDFYIKGDFLIGTRTDDVIAGLAIDAAPSGINIWTFLLPAFDDIEFMHMSLGQRVINLSLSEYPLDTSLKNVWRTVSYIRTAAEILAYLESGETAGEYVDWSRFLCFLRLGNFDEANAMLGLIENSKSAGIPRKVQELKAVKAYGGWQATQDLLIDWSARTGNLMDGVPLDKDGATPG